MTEKIVGIPVTPTTFGPILKPNFVGEIGRANAGINCPPDAEFTLVSEPGPEAGYYKIVENVLLFYRYPRQWWQPTLLTNPQDYLPDWPCYKIVDEEPK